MPKLKKKSTRSTPAVAAAARRRAPAHSPTAAPAPVRLARVAKGKKPQYFSDPAIDKLLWMTLTLMEELSVTRDRLDTVERLLAAKKVLRRAELEGWQPDAKAAAERVAARGRYVDRMMRAMHVELEEIAGRGMPKSEEEVVAAVES
ncbi:MAG: hypothetical protein ACKO3O_04305 [Gammaproteobacteria bacterium]